MSTTQANIEETRAELKRKGSVTTSWEALGAEVLPNGVETSQFRIGDPDHAESPTVFKVRFPPNCEIEPHSHDSDYCEIILEGRQKVTGKWHEAGDIRIGLANRVYGPLIAGEDGVTVLVIFADGRWPAIPLPNAEGGTLHGDQLADRFTSAT